MSFFEYLTRAFEAPQEVVFPDGEREAHLLRLRAPASARAARPWALVDLSSRIRWLVQVTWLRVGLWARASPGGAAQLTRRGGVHKPVHRRLGVGVHLCYIKVIIWNWTNEESYYSLYDSYYNLNEQQIALISECLSARKGHRRARMFRFPGSAFENAYWSTKTSRALGDCVLLPRRRRLDGFMSRGFKMGIYMLDLQCGSRQLVWICCEKIKL